MAVLYAAITNHGFGHATRSAALLSQLRTLYPEISLILATSAPRWLLEEHLDGDFLLRERTFDVGAVQTDSLQINYDATLVRLHELRAQAEELIREEVSFVRAQGVDLILADIPPLLAAIARAAGTPCWMFSNFGWDYIYGDWGGDFSPFASWMAELYGHCDRLFRVPFHEPMTAFPQREDVGLIGSSPRFTAEQIRQHLGLSPERPTVLLTFGGFGLQQVPYERLAEFPDWQFLSFDANAPEVANLITVPRGEIRPVDVMPVCERIVAKPGYSTLAEACRVGVPVVCLTREGFREADDLLRGLADCAQHRIVPAKDFYTQPWDFLLEPLLPPQQREPLDCHGEWAIIGAIADYLGLPQRGDAKRLS
jgi:hypothetical protein